LLFFASPAILLRAFQPLGPGSNISGKLQFPVVHVGYRDAFAFCVWANKRLPTEVEWQYIASAGSNGFYSSLCLSFSLYLSPSVCVFVINVA